LRWRNLGT